MYRNFTLILSMLALLAGNAMAQCSGKVYIELPEGWGNNLYLFLGGNFARQTTTKEGSWTVFTFSGLSNNAASSTFSISNVNEFYSAEGIMYINGTTVGRSNQLPTGSLKCSNFSGPTTYVSLVPNTPNIIIGTEPPNAKYFYLLPPHTRDWIEGIPYIMDANGSKNPMQLDKNSCGWYKAVYFNAPVPEMMIIGIGPSTLTPINNGIFNLAQKFEELVSDTIYFYADNNAWLTSRYGIPEQIDRCSYKMAAIIYDTDASVNSSFFDFDCSANGTGNPSDGSGILKGLVKNELKDGKIQWQGTSTSTTSCSGHNDGWNQANFEKAFKPTPGANVVRCYDMPFARAKDNLWEFDSNKLCSDGSIDLDGTCERTNKRFLGGFFPLELQTRGDGDYSDCPNCDKQRPAQGWVDFARDPYNTSLTTISKWCYDRGYLGPASVTGEGLTSAQAAQRCTRAFTNGDFRDGDNPMDFWDWEGGDGTTGLSLRRDGRVNGVTGTGANARVNTSGPIGAPGTTTIISSTGYGWSNKTMNKNELFCFESHAKFKYDPAHEFFFSGDDDIWVFINNKLVIDLGGTHLAAPGYVELSKLDLTEGETYPIDIFFCDRRTTMSNVRIASNVYFAQTSEDGNEAGLFLKQAGTGKEICLREALNSCAVLTGMANTEPVCGEELSPRLTYSLSVPGVDNIDLDFEDSGCVSTQGACLDGIALNNGVVSVNENALPNYLKILGFELYASAGSYGPFNVYKLESAATPSSSSGGDLPSSSSEGVMAVKALPVFGFQEPVYYNLKGEPLGKQKPKKAGVYIVRQNGVSKVAVVK